MGTKFLPLKEVYQSPVMETEAPDPFAEIWTIGYRRKKGMQTLLEWVKTRQTLVVDVRLKPNSMNPAWRKASFEGLFGEQYLWLPEWGNKNYNTGGSKPIEIANWEGGLERLREAERVAQAEPFGFDSVVLMCGCEELQGCHRRVLSERLGALGYALMGEVCCAA